MNRVPRPTQLGTLEPLNVLPCHRFVSRHGQAREVGTLSNLGGEVQYLLSVREAMPAREARLLSLLRKGRFHQQEREAHPSCGAGEPQSLPATTVKQLKAELDPLLPAKEVLSPCWGGEASKP